MSQPSRRPEMGFLRFGDDWTGVFFRGDNATHLGMQLQAMLEDVEPSISRSILEGLANTLMGADERGEGDEVSSQQLLSWEHCQPGAQSYTLTEHEVSVGTRWLEQHDKVCPLLGKALYKDCPDSRLTRVFVDTQVGILAKLLCECGSGVVLSHCPGGNHPNSFTDYP